MNDSDLLKISLGAATFGLMLLFFVSSQSEVPLVKISELSYDDAGIKVAVRGEVTSARIHKDGHIFIEIKDGTGKISIAIFKNVAEKLEIATVECITNIGSEVDVSGEVKEYRESLEIIPQGTGDIKC
ncbi:MAG: exodeoxyribonuclease VII large subunit [Candidatus Hydrothermarchaeaceae archaeon]